MTMIPGAVGWVILDSEPDIEVVGEAGDGRKVIEAARRHTRNCIPRRRLDSTARKLTFSIYQALLRRALESTVVGME
jgi:hypothetical protein